MAVKIFDGTKWVDLVPNQQEVHGIPAGGVYAEYLRKTSAPDYAVEWHRPSIVWATIWTNPSPAADFSSQTITVDLTSYSFVYVVGRLNSSNQTVQDGGCFVPINFTGTTKPGVMYGPASSYIYTRGFRVAANNSSIYFSNGFRNNSAGAGYMIPYRIYGGNIK